MTLTIKEVRIPTDPATALILVVNEPLPPEDDIVLYWYAPGKGVGAFPPELFWGKQPVIVHSAIASVWSNQRLFSGWNPIREDGRLLIYPHTELR